MEHAFLTIKQASERYEVSDVTLRRLAREITRDDAHQFRDCVRPGCEQLKALRNENKPFEYELSTRLLGVRYQVRGAETEEGSGTEEERAEKEAATATGILESTNEVLRAQLKVKDDQIRQLNESLRSMQQQQNATNVLLVRLSERIPMLTEGSAAKAEATEGQAVDAEAVVESKKEKSPRQAAKRAGKKKGTTKKKAKPARSRGVLGRWFRRAPTKAAAAK
jgi:uncharacterized protein YydD (DUF2326 family)